MNGGYTGESEAASPRLNFSDSQPIRRKDVAFGGTAIDWRQVAGGGMIAFGLVLVLVGWYGVSGETEEWKQFPYLLSGGIGGAAAIAIGLALLSSLEHSRDRAALAHILDRLDEIEAKRDSLAASDEHTPDAVKR